MHDQLMKATIPILTEFMPTAELKVMTQGLFGEEADYFLKKLVETAEVINTMPKTYETDGQGNAAIAWLHYFKNGFDWYITEKDVDSDNEGQIQAFGLVKMYETEVGYINIRELIANGVELDLHWTPKSLAEIKASL